MVAFLDACSGVGGCALGSCRGKGGVRLRTVGQGEERGMVLHSLISGK